MVAVAAILVGAVALLMISKKKTMSTGEALSVVAKNRAVFDRIREREAEEEDREELAKAAPGIAATLRFGDKTIADARQAVGEIRRAPIDWAAAGFAIGGDICPLLGHALGAVVGFAIGVIQSMAQGTHPPRPDAEVWKAVKSNFESSDVPTDAISVTWGYWAALLAVTEIPFYVDRAGKLAVRWPAGDARNKPLAWLADNELLGPVWREAQATEAARGKAVAWERTSPNPYGQQVRETTTNAVVAARTGERNQAGQLLPPWTPMRWEPAPGLYVLTPFASESGPNRGEEARGVHFAVHWRASFVQPIMDGLKTSTYQSYGGPYVLKDTGPAYVAVLEWFRRTVGALRHE